MPNPNPTLFIHSSHFYSIPFKSSTTQRRSRLQHGYCIGVSRRSAQATAGNGLAQGPYVSLQHVTHQSRFKFIKTFHQSSFYLRNFVHQSRREKSGRKVLNSTASCNACTCDAGTVCMYELMHQCMHICTRILKCM